MLHFLSTIFYHEWGGETRSEREAIPMEIRSLHIDFDNDILEINGKRFEKATIVNLPGGNGWDIQKLFNTQKFKAWKECDRLKVQFIPAKR